MMFFKEPFAEWASLLQNRILHNSGAFKEIEKPDVKKLFQPKTEYHILKFHVTFSRACGLWMIGYDESYWY